MMIFTEYKEDKQMTNLISIQNKEGQLLVSSREVAGNFEKRHDHILRDIEKLVSDSPKLGNETSELGNEFFIFSRYRNTRGQLYPEYLLTRDGFTLLAMGFTGSKALQWKLKYIEAFNKMEQTLKEGQPLQIDSKFIYQIAQQLEEKEKQIALQGQIIGELKPKADYTDRILKNKGLVTITQIAKDYGMSGQAMNDLLHELKVQYKQSGQWLLYVEHQGRGYTHSETIDIVRSNGMADVKMNTKWTQKGRLFLYELLKENKIYPDIEKPA